MRTPRRLRWLKILTILSVLYTVLLWFLVEIVGERTPFTALLMTIPQAPLLLPNVVLLAICAATVRWRLALGHAVAVSPFVWTLLGVQFHPFRETIEGPTIRVLTYNVHSGQAGWDSIAATIEAQNPDVFCLQEALGRPSHEFQAMFPRYHVVRRRELLVASRWPIDETRFRTYNRRPAQVLGIRTHGFWFETTHLASFDNWRELARPNEQVLERSEYIIGFHQRQAKDIADMDGDIEPLILCGDFNLPPRGSAYRLLRTRFVDAFASVGNGLGYTHPSIMPFHRIDYIMCRGVTVESCRPIPSRSSDHLPLIATVAVPVK